MQVLMPEMMMVAGVLVTLVVGMVLPQRRMATFTVAILTLLAAGVESIRLWGIQPGLAVHNSLLIDSFTVLITWLVVAAGLSTLLLAYHQEGGREEFPALVLISVLGMMLMGMAGNLVMLFLGIEVLSLPLYILSASAGTGPSGESGLKYLLLGAFSSGILLFGMALVYGATGTMTLLAFGQAAKAAPVLLGLGFILLLVGLGFKLAIVPFHMWVPDVYEGAPTPVTNLMAFGTKVGAAAAMLRVLDFGFYVQAAWWGPLLVYLAVLTMIVGNLLALPQKDLKRLLAYSGIGNAGFLLVGMAAHNFLGSMATLFYLIPYGLAIIGAFAVVQLLQGQAAGITVADLKGLAYKQPLVAALFIVVMLSLAGIPLTGGFIGKFYLIEAALIANDPGLAIGLVVATMVGLVAYLRPLQAMFQREMSAPVSRLRWSWAGGIVLLIAAVGTVGLGVYPGPVVHMVNQSANFYWLP